MQLDADCRCSPCPLNYCPYLLLLEDKKVASLELQPDIFLVKIFSHKTSESAAAVLYHLNLEKIPNKDSNVPTSALQCSCLHLGSDRKTSGRFCSKSTKCLFSNMSDQGRATLLQLFLPVNLVGELEGRYRWQAGIEVFCNQPTRVHSLSNRCPVNW